MHFSYRNLAGNRWLRGCVALRAQVRCGIVWRCRNGLSGMWCSSRGTGSFLSEVRGADDGCSPGVCRVSFATADANADAASATKSANPGCSMVRVRGLPGNQRTDRHVLSARGVDGRLRWLWLAVWWPHGRRVWSRVDDCPASFRSCLHGYHGGSGVAGWLQSADTEAVGPGTCHRRRHPDSVEAFAWDGTGNLHAVGAGSVDVWR